MIANLTKWDVVEIFWRDSMILDQGEWMNDEDLEDPMSDEGMMHRTVGFFVRENDNCIAICSSRNDQPGQGDRIAGGMVIPKGCIVSMKVLAVS